MDEGLAGPDRTRDHGEAVRQVAKVAYLAVGKRTGESEGLVDGSFDFALVGADRLIAAEVLD